jgi:NAD(P)-dependent dehydrogenase (short-subunit alcohol dehydrogenase family)
MQVRDTSAIVTGAASGLGAAAAAALAAGGAVVFGLDLPTAIKAAPAVEGLTYVGGDVTDGSSVQAVVDAAAASGPPLRTVVNCAGIAPSMRIVGRKGPHDLGLFATVLSVNLGGTFNVMTLAAAAIAATEPQEDGQRGVVVTPRRSRPSTARSDRRLCGVEGGSWG